jgi:hypothetical protein
LPPQVLDEDATRLSPPTPLNGVITYVANHWQQDEVILSDPHDIFPPGPNLTYMVVERLRKYTKASFLCMQEPMQRANALNDPASWKMPLGCVVTGRFDQPLILIISSKLASVEESDLVGLEPYNFALLQCKEGYPVGDNQKMCNAMWVRRWSGLFMHSVPTPNMVAGAPVFDERVNWAQMPLTLRVLRPVYHMMGENPRLKGEIFSYDGDRGLSAAETLAARLADAHRVLEIDQYLTSFALNLEASGLAPVINALKTIITDYPERTNGVPYEVRFNNVLLNQFKMNRVPVELKLHAAEHKPYGHMLHSMRGPATWAIICCTAGRISFTLPGAIDHDITIGAGEAVWIPAHMWILVRCVPLQVELSTTLTFTLP